MTTGMSVKIVIGSRDRGLFGRVAEILGRHGAGAGFGLEPVLLDDANEVRGTASRDEGQVWLVDGRPALGIGKFKDVADTVAKKTPDKALRPLLVMFEEPAAGGVMGAWTMKYQGMAGVLFPVMLDDRPEELAKRLVALAGRVVADVLRRRNRPAAGQLVSVIPRIEPTPESGEADDGRRFVTLGWGKMADFMMEVRRAALAMRRDDVGGVRFPANPDEAWNSVLMRRAASSRAGDKAAPGASVWDAAVSPRVEDDPGETKVFWWPRSGTAVKPVHLLLYGETGSGKTLLANMMKQMLNVAKGGKLVRVNAAGLSATMLEHELFGHTENIATDMTKPRVGAALAAVGGVLFFDEIAEMPLELQPRLLTFLDELRVTPAGMTEESPPLPLYVVAATNHDITGMMGRDPGTEPPEKRMRLDLLHRFQLKIRIPSMAERREDVPQLVRFILGSAAVNFTLRYGWEGARIETVTRAFLDRAGSLDLPGNFRELEEVVGAAVWEASRDQADILDEVHLEAALKRFCRSAPQAPAVGGKPAGQESKPAKPGKMQVTDAMWRAVGPLVPKPPKFSPAERRVPDRPILEAILWCAEHGGGWRDLPAGRFPSWQTCRRRLLDWKRSGAWKRISAALVREAPDADRSRWKTALARSFPA